MYLIVISLGDEAVSGDAGQQTGKEVERENELGCSVPNHDQVERLHHEYQQQSHACDRPQRC